jgi:glycine/D-amino acid oxidase-like deaminating enzyme
MWLPFRPVKGEILMIDPEIQIDFIYNRKIFILPYKKGLYKVGSTYTWDYMDVLPTEEAKNFLEEKLNQIFRVKYNVVAHFAGIRPATKDRRPFIGMHPDYPFVGIFNGLGSKGVSLGPYFAQQFVGYLLKDKELDKEVNINRYY